MKRILLPILAIGIFLLGACATPTAAPAPVPAPELQPAPASAPTPEPELIPAPLPVQEPEPEPAPPIVVEEPALTPDEQAYITATQDYFSEMEELFIKIGVLFGDPQLESEPWIIEVLVLTYIIKFSSWSEAKDIIPPTSMQDIHLKFLEAVDHFGTAAYLIAPYIDDIDPDPLGAYEAALQERRIGTRLMNDTIRLMNLFRIAHE